jgi:hypothetical protein
MTRLYLAAAVAGISFIAGSGAHAEWCRMGRDIQDCSFKTEAQCRSAGSGLGVACIEKPGAGTRKQRETASARKQACCVQVGGVWNSPFNPNACRLAGNRLAVGGVTEQAYEACLIRGR